MLSFAGTGAGSDPNFLKRIDNMVLLPDGNVFCKFTDKFWGYAIYNPLTNARSADFANHEMANTSPSYGKGVLAADKKTVIFPPRNFYKPLIYNSNTNAFTTNSTWEEETAIVTTNRYLGGTLTNDGRVFFPPYNAQYGALYSLSDDKMTKITSVFSGGSTPAYNGAYLLPNGLIFLLAGTKPFALFDLNTYTLTDVPELVNYKRYMFACMTADEFLLLFPEPGYSNPMLLYDYASNSLVNQNSIMSFNSHCYGATILANGGVLAIFTDGLYQIKIKENGNKIEKTRLHASTEFNYVSKMIPLLNGKVLIVSEGGNPEHKAWIYSSDIEVVPFHPSVYLSPFYNRS